MRSFALAATLSLTSISLACTPVVIGGGDGPGTGARGTNAPPEPPPLPPDAGAGGSPGVGGSPGAGGSPVVAQAPRLLAGGDTTCWLGAAGHLACWGDNETGELGLGDYQDRRTPTWIPGLSGVIDVAVGDMEVCARKSDGTVWCWGDNFYGELDATNLPYCSFLGATCTPVPVLSMAQASGPIAYGDQGFCAVGVPAGDLTCWGATPPADVSGYHALSAAVGYDHLCVIVAPAGSAHNVVCFGDSGAGQLGTGTSYASAPISADAAFVEIAAGYEHTCGVDTAGVVWCWGSNQFGALGVGSPTDDSNFPQSCGESGGCSPTPLPVAGLPPVAHVAAHDVEVCAQTVDGHVYCWGTPSHTSPASAGACFSNNPDCSPTPVLVAGVEHATSITVGNGHACATTGPAEVTCWGLDTHGQLGRGAGPDWDPTPAAVTIPPEPM